MHLKHISRLILYVPSPRKETFVLLCTAKLFETHSSLAIANAVGSSIVICS